MWSHKCCDNSEKKCGARWCLTSNAASWSSGNNRSCDWGSWLSRVIEESQGSFHLSRLIILSHSAASQLVICALKLPFSNYSSAFVFKRQTHLWFSIDVFVFLSLAENKREKNTSPPKKTYVTSKKCPSFHFDIPPTWRLLSRRLLKSVILLIESFCPAMLILMLAVVG